MYLHTQFALFHFFELSLSSQLSFPFKSCFSSLFSGETCKRYLSKENRAVSFSSIKQLKTVENYEKAKETNSLARTGAAVKGWVSKCRAQVSAGADGARAARGAASCSQPSSAMNCGRKTKPKLAWVVEKSQLTCKLQRSSSQLHMIGFYLNYLRCSAHSPVIITAAHQPAAPENWRNRYPVPQKSQWNQLGHTGQGSLYQSQEKF